MEKTQTKNMNQELKSQLALSIVQAGIITTGLQVNIFDPKSKKTSTLDQWENYTHTTPAAKRSYCVIKEEPNTVIDQLLSTSQNRQCTQGNVE